MNPNHMNPTGMIRPDRSEPRPLEELVDALDLSVVGDLAGARASGLALRTQDLRPGDLFAALPGAHVHGAAFVEEARGRGAVAVLTDRAGAELAGAEHLPLLVTDDPRVALGDVAAWVHRTTERMPLLLGVTGTDGKTSTVHLLEHVLELLGTPAGVSSTAERGARDERGPSRLTTPEADELHALLARMVERGVRAAAVEVSAQALVRSRIAGLVFDVAGFTNLTHEHLDDFGSMAAYREAKARLFTPGSSRRAVICLDSPAGGEIARTAQVPVTTVASAAAAAGTAADWHVGDVVLEQDGTWFTLTGPAGERLRTRLDALGAHQAVNAAVALVMLVEAGFAFERIAAVVADGIRLRVPGRLEHLPGSCDPTIHLDLAHTPDALEKSLTALRTITRGRLVVVFGADGDRDPTKRGPMGRVAAQLADVVVVHDHHSRFEDPERIRAMLLAGARAVVPGALVLDEPDPAIAVRVAIEQAGVDGAVLWAGTGRTGYRDIAGVKQPFSFWDEATAAAAEHARVSAA